jgi:hypothetical protein
MGPQTLSWFETAIGQDLGGARLTYLIRSEQALYLPTQDVAGSDLFQVEMEDRHVSRVSQPAILYFAASRIASSGRSRGVARISPIQIRCQFDSCARETHEPQGAGSRETTSKGTLSSGRVPSRFFGSTHRHLTLSDSDDAAKRMKRARRLWSSPAS